MPALAHRPRRRWTSKPGPGHRIDPSHPLVEGRNLLGAWVFNEEGGNWAYDLILGTRIRLVGADATHPAWKPASFGLGPAFAQNSQYGFTSDPAGTAVNMPIPAAFSVAAGVMPSAATQAGFARVAETDYQAGWYLGADTNGTAYQWIVNSTGTGGFGSVIAGSVAAGVAASLVGTFAPGPGGPGATGAGTLYVDRLPGASGVFHNVTPAAGPIYLGTAQSGPGAGFGFQGTYKYLYYYGSALTAADARWLNDEHYAFVLGPGGRRRSAAAASGRVAFLPVDGGFIRGK